MLGLQNDLKQSHPVCVFVVGCHSSLSIENEHLCFVNVSCSCVLASSLMPDLTWPILALNC